MRLTAHPKHEKNNEPVELAVAVLDEAVFDLIRQGNAYFDPYRGFYDLKGLDVDLKRAHALGEQDTWAKVVGDTPFKLVRLRRVRSAASRSSLVYRPPRLFRFSPFAGQRGQSSYQ